MATSDLQSPRTTVKRLASRAAYDRDTVYAILDEGLVCHIGFVADGQPYVIPANYARIGDRLYLHGSAASRMLRALTDGQTVCVSVTLVDGVVLARSAFHHSLNYRSAVVLGTARAVTDLGEKAAALAAIVEHVVPGRSRDTRPPNEKETLATKVLCLPIVEASAKSRSGPPNEEPEDLGSECWAGEIPLRLTPRAVIPDPRLAPGGAVPENARNYRRPQRLVPAPVATPPPDGEPAPAEPSPGFASPRHDRRRRKA